MAQVKFGNRMVEITGDIYIDGNPVDSSLFIGKLLNQIEALKTGQSTVPLSQGGSAQTPHSAVPPSSTPSTTSPSTSTGTSGVSGTKVKCPECGSMVDEDDICPDCHKCFDGCCECEEEEDDTPPPAPKVVATPSVPGATTGRISNGTPVQSAKPSVPVSTGMKGWDDFEY